MNRSLLLGKVIKKYKQDGLIALLKASINFLNDRYERAKLLAKKYDRSIRHGSAAPSYDDYIYIRGDGIKYQLIPKTIPHDQGSFILGGEWDQNHIETDRDIIPTYENWPEWNKIRDRDSPGLVPYHQLSHVKGFKELFNMDKNRDEVGFSKKLYEVPETNDKKYRPRDKVDERLDYDREIYSSIKKHGFIPARDRPDVSGHDDIGIAITRNGEIAKIISGSGHRAAFCHILGLEKVPVKVQLRHKKWQEIRVEVAKAGTADDLSDQAIKHISHPDIENLL